MSTTISIIGGVGLFLLGMTVMTAGLKGLAGSGLRTVLSNAAATPLRGAFWGGVATLLVQSSSATTMTTIGLVSAGLLTFPQGLGLVFGANVGTTGAGWRARVRGGRGVRRIRAGPVWTDNPAGGDGRAGRTAAPGRPAGCARRSRRRVVVEFTRRVGSRRRRAGHDRGDAVVDRGHLGDALRSVRGSDWARPGLRADHRAEHRHRHQFRDGSNRREQHGQAVGPRLRVIQGDRRRDRVAAVPRAHADPYKRLAYRRRRDAAGWVPHGVQPGRRPSAAAADRPIHAVCRAHAAGTNIGAHALPRPCGARNPYCGRGSGTANSGGRIDSAVQIARQWTAGREPRRSRPAG